MLATLTDTERHQWKVYHKLTRNTTNQLNSLQRLHLCRLQRQQPLLHRWHLQHQHRLHRRSRCQLLWDTRPMSNNLANLEPIRRIPDLPWACLIVTLMEWVVLVQGDQVRDSIDTLKPLVINNSFLFSFFCPYNLKITETCMNRKCLLRWSMESAWKFSWSLDFPSFFGGIVCGFCIALNSVGFRWWIGEDLQHLILHNRSVVSRASL